MSSEWPSVDEIHKRYLETAPAWFPLVRTYLLGILGVMLWLAAVGLTLYALIEGWAPGSWIALAVGSAALGLAVIGIAAVRLVLWFRRRRRTAERPSV